MIEIEIIHTKIQKYKKNPRKLYRNNVKIFNKLTLGKSVSICMAQIFITTFVWYSTSK
jgi:hypothetical protein